jgi:hypothetical protein
MKVGSSDIVHSLLALSLDLKSFISLLAVQRNEQEKIS